jgi:hypothetical protein
VSLVNLTWSHDLVVWVFNELIPVSQPSRQSGKSKHNCEHFSWDAERLVDNAGIEINVRVKLALNEEIVGKSDTLEFHSNINLVFATDNAENIFCNLADNSSARIIVFIDSVSETHQNFLSVFDILNELRNRIDGADLIKHTEYGFVGTTVAGSVKSSDGSSKRSVNIGLT